jgi:hypothetical protein
MSAAQLVCQYPGCSTGGQVERCANADGRLACAAHRTFRGYGYVCSMCEHEAAKQRESDRRGQLARDAYLYGATQIGFLVNGTIASVLLYTTGVIGGFAFAALKLTSHEFDDPVRRAQGCYALCKSFGTLPDVALGGVVGLAALVGIAFSIRAWRRTDGFRHRGFDGKSDLRKAAYYLNALPGLVVGGVLVIPLVIAVAIAALFVGVGAGAAGSASDSYAAVQTIRQGVREGVEDAFD